MSDEESTSKKSPIISPSESPPHAHKSTETPPKTPPDEEPPDEEPPATPPPASYFAARGRRRSSMAPPDSQEINLPKKGRSASRRGSQVFLMGNDNIMMTFDGGRRLSSFCTTSSNEYILYYILKDKLILCFF
jgi:hypothetical protein